MLPAESIFIPEVIMGEGIIAIDFGIEVI